MNFWRRTIRSILDFISFPGMPDQGGHSVKVLSFSEIIRRVNLSTKIASTDLPTGR